eukprot:1563416-Rhodomonas_salina.1
MATNSTCSVEVMDEWYLGISAVITVAQQVFFFIIAAGFKFDKVTDFAGGLLFALRCLVFEVKYGGGEDKEGVTRGGARHSIRQELVPAAADVRSSPDASLQRCRWNKLCGGCAHNVFFGGNLPPAPALGIPPPIAAMPCPVLTPVPGAAR